MSRLLGIALALLLAWPAAAQTVFQPPVAGGASTITLGSTVLTLGGTTTDVAGLTLSGGTLSGTTTLSSGGDNSIIYNPSLTKGALSVVQTGTGAMTGPIGGFSGFPQWLFTLTENATTGGEGVDSGVIGFEIDLNYTGGVANTNTLHTALVASAKQTAATTFGVAPGDGIAGIFTQGAALATQGGTVGGANARGRVWGAATIASLLPGATGFVSVIGNETDVLTRAGTSLNGRFGIAVVDYGSAVQGTNEDAAFAAWAATGSVAFKRGLSFTTFGGAYPVATTGTLISSTGTATIANGIDLSSGLTITGSAFKSPGFQVGGSTKTFDLTAIGLGIGRANPSSAFQVRVATDANFSIATQVSVAGATVVEALNDASNALTPIEARGPWYFTDRVVIGASALTLATGEIGYTKITASGSAPGAAGAKEAWVCGTSAGTAKKIAYAGTSATPVTVIDNVGTGVTGC